MVPVDMVRTSDVRIQASRIRIRIQPPRIRIQLNPNPLLFSWIRIWIQLFRIRIRIQIQLDIEGPNWQQMANSSGVIGTKNLESGFESESTLFFLNSNPDSYLQAPHPAQKTLNPDLNLHITGPDFHLLQSQTIGRLTSSDQKLSLTT